MVLQTPLFFGWFPIIFASQPLRDELIKNGPWNYRGSHLTALYCSSTLSPEGAGWISCSVTWSSGPLLRDVPKHLGLVEMLGTTLPVPILCSGVIAGWLQWQPVPTLGSSWSPGVLGFDLCSYTSKSPFSWATQRAAVIECGMTLNNQINNLITPGVQNYSGHCSGVWLLEQRGIMNYSSAALIIRKFMPPLSPINLFTLIYNKPFTLQQ